EGRNPCPYFDSAWYLKTYPDVERSRTSPLVHYLETGNKEGRLPHPSFNRGLFINRYRDEARRNSNAASRLKSPDPANADEQQPMLHFLAYAFGQDCADRVGGYFQKYGLSSTKGRRTDTPSRKEIDNWVDDLRRLEPAAPADNPDVSIVIPVFN